MKLAGKVAVITGGAMGIGRAIAEGLATEGARIVIADRARAVEAAAAMSAQGFSAAGIATDVANEADVERMAKHAVETFGGIDILIPNAAIFTTIRPKPFHEITAQEWRDVMDVNTLGVFLSVRACLAALSRSTSGRVITISSGVAFKGNPLYLHYVASKGAVVSMTRSLARELGPRKILVNSLAPGFTLSDGVLANPALIAGARKPSLGGRTLERDMYPSDLVGAALFFAGPDSAFITGQTLVVDGGTYFH
ncbi:MAG: SDR family oxidoreductase [Betaproteobacteria bacterium]|nr:SDR family oxidoreductase [Betaproteobacteria bacterium]